MFRKTAFPHDLEFLTRIVGDRNDQYREAPWRQGQFEADVWRCVIGNRRMEIDFRVKLDDGDLLTAPRHHELLSIFKCWLCIQTHFDATGGRTLGQSTQWHRICRTLHLIDFFLLNADHLKLAVRGLNLITENDLKGVLITLSQSNSIAKSLYQWPTRLQTFLRQQISSMGPGKVAALISQKPSLCEHLPDKNERLLNLTNEEIVQSRAWLWAAGIYKYGHDDYRHSPNTEKLSQLLYANTLYGVTGKKPVPEELRLEPMERYAREYTPVPVRNAVDDRNFESVLSLYMGHLRCLGLLEEIHLPVPLQALRAFDSTDIGQVLNLKDAERFRTLPQQVVFHTLRNAVEFCLKYGDDLIDSYLTIRRAARQENLGCRLYGDKHDIGPLLAPTIRELGVSKWAIDPKPTAFLNDGNRGSREEYFKQLRSNKGLWQLLRVLYGGVQLCIGTLMARRSGELLDLVAGQCLDRTRTRLVFFNRKSGEAGTREKEARPIPTVAVTLIGQLERLQKGLMDLALLEQPTSLFSYPNQTGDGLVVLTSVSYYGSIDFFCDYFETPLNRDGNRYYIRHHQLRRFFAMLFFWGRSFGGMDTLRWFLGHTDVEHLYHYITESTTGEVLRSIKANYAAEQVKGHNDVAEALAALVEQHFGTRNFSILDSDELEEYIEDLMDEGQVEIEPVFFETPEGKSYRVLIKVHPGGRP